MSSAAPISQPQSQAEPLLSATLIDSKNLSGEVRLLIFQAEDSTHFEFLAGQSIRIELQINEKRVLLVYSIASPPERNNRFELCVRAGRKGSAPDRLYALKEGAQIQFAPPQGTFVLQQPDEDAVFLAAGTGIAPIRSMIHWLMPQNGTHKTTLLFGARGAEELFFHSEFLALAERHPHFRYLPVLSRPHPGWSGARGHVQHHLNGIPSTPTPARVYVCGPPAMVRSATGSLTQMGWPSRLIHFDRDCS
jgi:ferredoxin-NADP reductase